MIPQTNHEDTFMNKLGLVKLTTLAVCCAFGFGMVSAAKADGFSIGYHSGGHWGGQGHGHYSVSVGVGSPYYGGYYAPRHRYYAPRSYYNAPSYSYYEPAPYYSDFNNDDGYYAPSYNSSYYRGYGHDYDRDDYDRDDRYSHRDYDRDDYDRDDYDD